MKRQVTMQDVARAAGVDRSTVSLALRNDRRISTQVKERVRKVAAELGYRTNPLVSALMQRRRTRSEVAALPIGYVTCYPTRWGWCPPELTNRPDYFPGAKARAEELGCSLTHLWLREPGMTTARFTEVLETRGITGLVIGRLPAGLETIDLPWERFSCVAVGRTLRSPVVHRVAEDHFASAVLAMKELIGKGYRRIGYVASAIDDSPGVADRWLGGYLRDQILLRPADRLPPFIYDAEAEPERSFGDWFDHQRPDALLVTEAEPVLRWVAALGRPKLGEIGFGALVKDRLDAGWSGIHSNAEDIGARAVEMVVGLMTRGEIGLSASPYEVLLPGRWVD